MNTTIGKAAAYVRECFGLRQKDMADALGVSVVHYCNIENGKSAPSLELLERYRELWGIDLCVLGWCLYGDVEKLPESIRAAAAKLTLAWKEELAKGGVL